MTDSHVATLLLRYPKFLVRVRSRNFDRCHSFLLASSATGGARKRPLGMTITKVIAKPVRTLVVAIRILRPPLHKGGLGERC